MQESMQGAWWAVLLRGIVAVVFGLGALGSLAVLFGALGPGFLILKAWAVI